MKQQLSPVLLIALSVATLSAQTPAAPAIPLEFETALVKQVTVPSDGRFMFGCRVELAQLTCGYAHLRDLLSIAYPLTGGAKLNAPEWIDTLTYRVVAKAPDRMKPGDLKAMVGQLLASRFQLKIHEEERAMQGYALLVDPKGLKLNPVKFDGDPAKGYIHYVASGIEFSHISMVRFATTLSYQLNRPVVDETGVKDLFDFKLIYAMTRNMAADLNPPADNNQPTILEAIKKIGLKLESRPAQVTDYIVDHLERIPSDN